MSLRIIKAGMLDTIQDHGRYGYRHLGINPGGSMDRFSAAVVNMLTGSEPGDPVIEMHFPAATILFEKEMLIAIGGADFDATVNGEKIPLWHPVLLDKNSLLQFHHPSLGARCYLAVSGMFRVDKWLNSYSTNLKAEAGGFNGRSLLKDDVILIDEKRDYSKYLNDKDFAVLPWKADADWNKFLNNAIEVLPGNELDNLTNEARDLFFNQPFTITTSSDRMGYRLNGPVLETVRQTELVSSAVTFGTIQLLPDGQLIVLMADHQTTGGYPRIAHVTSTNLSRIAQMRPGEKIQFKVIDQKTAEDLFINQTRHLLQLQNACKFRLQEFFSDYT